MKTFVMLSITLIVVAATFQFNGCSKKSDVAPITEWAQFQQQYFKLAFTYPKGWTAVSDAGLMAYYSSPEAIKKFTDPYSDGPVGSQLMYVYRQQDTLKTLQQELDDYVKGLKDQGFTIKAQEDRQLLGQPGKFVSYGGKLSSKVRLDVMRVFTIKDSVLYFIQFGAFNDFYEAHKVAFDSAYKSLRINEPKPAAAANLSEIPSPELETFENDKVRFSHPVNFDVNIPAPKKDIMFSLEVRGVRRDCTVQLDIRSAQKLSLDKVVEQNSKSIKSTGKGEAKIDGERAVYFVYSPMKSIKSRIYFVVKNDKFYRIIMNYYVPMESDYLPAFEKLIGSIRLK